MRLRRAALVALVIAGVVLPPAARAATTPETPYPGGAYAPPPATYGTSEDAGVPIRMSDGVTLKADILYPTDQETGQRAKGPFPVLLTQDIYASSPIGALQSLGSGPGPYFVQRGYIFIHLNTRGTGGSEGTGDNFGPRLGIDGVEVAYWAANPKNVRGSNGTVGLQGCSALGITQLDTLAQLGRLQREGVIDPRTNPIKASIPRCLSGDFYRDIYFDNGIPTSTFGLFNAGLVFSGVNTESPSSNLGQNAVWLDTTAGGDKGFYRQYWQDRDRVLHAPDIARTGVPVLQWVGWGEGGFMSAQQIYAVLQNVAARRPPFAPMVPHQKVTPRYQVIIGDWAHAGGPDPGIEIEWFDTWLKGVRTGLRSADQPIHLQELPSASTSRWVNATTYPMTTQYTPYYLASGNALSTNPPATASSDRVAWAPGSSVTYTITEAFAEDMTLIGPSALKLWAQSSNTNMQFYAELNDVGPDGTSTPITHASFLASRRALDPAKSWKATNTMPIRPYPTFDDDDYVSANTPVELHIPLQPVTWRLAKDHKLALTIATQAPADACAKNSAIGVPYGCTWTRPMLETLPGGLYQILHGPTHASAINVGIVPSRSLTTARSGATPTSNGVAMPQDWG